MHSNVLTKINSSRVARDASRRHREGGNPWTLHFLIVAKINSFRAARDARSRSRESGNPCTLHVLIVASINSFRAARDTSRHSRAGGNSWTLHVLIVAKINSFRAARDFISFDKRQKKRSKEKRFLDEAPSPALMVPTFFDSPSWLGRKTAHIHVRCPPGIQTEGQIACRSRSLETRILEACDTPKKALNNSKHRRHSREGGDPATVSC